ncbi:SMC domain protein [uncultured Gammaproteobacteria bacterium]|jgi:AAA15 family ATPase/GTPase|nr:SMC domain protein [uncultured Gammaproteobacteria bacterium]CAC9564645.1 SMC domain protein [uncultured Gammaproteobacteria bacterium]CAC9594353.1 SMC domain protein [uncultured Gammaproteobacteria bacterium]
MLEKFSVTNFKNFNKKLTFDFTASDYQFNPQSVKEGVVKTAIVYGANASGKSNLGFAIFDIVQHLTDNESKGSFYQNYLTKPISIPYAEFEYCFKFEQNEVVYRYSKTNHEILLDEFLSINKKEVLSVKRTDKKKNANFSLQGAESLNQEIANVNLSIVKYVKENTILENNGNNAVFNQFFDFINKMLFFRSLEHSAYLGLENGSKAIDKDIIDQGHVVDFEKFLNEAGIKCKLGIAKDINNEEKIVFDFGGDDSISFFDIASQGTRAMALFYYWYQRIQSNKTSFVFIDEFDAFYHHNLSKFIIKKLQKIDVQVVFTTHNTDIMTNDLSRPDCYFILNDNKITSVNKLTDQELRKAHNLQKLYKAHAFE